MSRIRNADEFLLKFRQICRNYERIFGSRIAEIRQKYASGPERDLIDCNLEAHVRVYIVSGEIYHCAHRDVNSAKQVGLPQQIGSSVVHEAARKVKPFAKFGALSSISAVGPVCSERCALKRQLFACPAMRRTGLRRKSHEETSY
ncbi:MAG: hypothetical protein DRP09_16830 [Candidatus Thorarchaeota archaeon]|nr:MAG: hypothetical protein DRP09_16830 [Candidatus Thorarchaeota archaeon]